MPNLFNLSEDLLEHTIQIIMDYKDSAVLIKKHLIITLEDFHLNFIFINIANETISIFLIHVFTDTFREKRYF